MKRIYWLSILLIGVFIGAVLVLVAIPLGYANTDENKEKNILERLKELEDWKAQAQKKVLYFTSSLPHNTIVNEMTVLTGLSYTVEIEGIYNIDYGACLYFEEARNKHAGLYLCVNGNTRDWKARYAGAVNVLEFDGHYQCLLKKGDLVDIRAKRIFTDNPNIDLKLYNDREWDCAPYLRLTKVFAE